MQTAFKLEENKSAAKKLVAADNLILTARDLEVISFIHEMKFATIEDIHFKFFRILKDGSESKSQWWTRERLSLLHKHNYLARVYSFSERKGYFLGTIKGLVAIVKHCPTKWPVRPLGKIDFKTFEHDKLVLQLRLRLEATWGIRQWISDRQLFQFPELCLNLGEGHRPDAIYTNAGDEKVAFELEIAVKAKSRYQHKIKKYVQLMRTTNLSQKIFDRVQFVCAKETVADFLIKETRIYGDLFQVLSVEELFSKKAGV